MAIDNRVIRDSESKVLAPYLIDAVANTSEDIVSAHLLASVKNESISPTVFTIWLSIRKSPRTLLDALTQDFSVLVRRRAIKQLGKELRGPRWREIWEGLGAAPGLVSMLSTFSVLDVRSFTKVIARCGWGIQADDKRDNVTDILRLLRPDLFDGDDQHKHQDLSNRRPLSDHYAVILPACSATKLEQLWGSSHLPYSILFSKYHPELIRRICVGDALSTTTQSKAARDFYLPMLFRRSPSCASKEASFSETMLFSLDYLRYLVKSGKEAISASIFMQDLVEPLIRRAYKKLRPTNEWTRLEEIIDLTLAYMKHHPDSAKDLHFEKSGFLYYVARCWYHNEEMFQAQLSTSLRLSQQKRDKPVADYKRLFDVVRSGRKHLRYTLLRLCFLARSEKRGDIDNVEGLKQIPMSGWPAALFFALDRPNAIQLLRRLRDARPETEYSAPGEYSSILTLSLGTKYDNAALLLMLVERLGDFEGWLAGARKAIDDRRKKAATSREPEDRAKYSNAALGFAIASGSLDLYGETLLWARRFIRDPQTLKLIYHGNDTTLNTKEAINLLSAVPEVIPKSLTAAILRSKMIQADEILYQIFETACMALKEPSFYLHNWHPSLELFRHVIERRLKLSKKVQKSMNLSDDETYEIIWENSVALLLKVEREALECKNEGLEFTYPYGPLRSNNMLEPMVVPDGIPSSYRFVDNLCRARDELWRIHRPTLIPASASLTSPWPLGLPIQFLSGSFKLEAWPPEKLLPYLSSRATAIVFQDADVALGPLPKDEETRLAIGGFIDDYLAALALYIPPCSDGEERERRLKLAWDHATGPLNQGRMSTKEAVEYWYSKFADAIGYKGVPFPESEWYDAPEYYHVLPREGDPSEPLEFNPLKPERSAIPERNLQPTRLDCMVQPEYRRSEHPSNMPMLIPKYGLRIERKDFRAGWVCPGYYHRTPELRDAQVAAALLLLDSKTTGPSRILSAPFPSRPDPRYPSVFLEEEFLLNLATKEGDARNLLKEHLILVPPTLLAALTKSALNAVSNNPANPVEAERMANSLLSLLTKCDRPQLASSLVTKTIVENPDASSWHRQWLSKTLLSTLSAAHSRDTIQSFASAIIAKLDEQARRPPLVVKDGELRPQKPLVKVTTVKYLAQILDGAEFVSESVIVDVLCDILQKASHIDIRVAVIAAMFNMLAGCPANTADPLASKLLTSLEKTIRIAGSLDERRPMTEEEWQVAETTKVAPEVYEDGGFTKGPPVYAELKSFVSSAHRSAFWQQEIFTRVLLPTIEASRINASRWMAIYLAQHHSTLSASDLPSIPFRPEMLEIVQNHATWTPRKLLDLFHNFVLTNIAPPEGLKRLIDRIKFGNAGTKELNQSRYFLHIWGNGPDALLSGALKLSTLLRRHWQPSTIPQGIEKKQVAHVLFEQAGAVLKLEEPAFGTFWKFKSGLFEHNLACDNLEAKNAWLQNVRPLVEQIIKHIDGTRTEAWQQDAHRVPAYLPPTLELRLLLLSYPSLPSLTLGPQASKEETCRVFANEIVAFIEEFTRKRTYHADFALLRAAVMKCPHEYVLWVAVELGHIQGELDTARMLRIELADGLMRAVRQWKGKDAGILQRARAMAQGWARNEHEEVRMVGVRLLEAVSVWLW